MDTPSVWRRLQVEAMLGERREQILKAFAHTTTNQKASTGRCMMILWLMNYVLMFRSVLYGVKFK
jgi:hypothetical protein